MATIGDKIIGDKLKDLTDEEKKRLFQDVIIHRVSNKTFRHALFSVEKFFEPHSLITERSKHGKIIILIKKENGEIKQTT